MDCRFCGNPLNEKALFCKKCGQPVADTFRAADESATQIPRSSDDATPVSKNKQASDQTPSSSGYPPTAPARHRSRRQRRPGCLPLSLIVLMIMIILMFVVFKTFVGNPRDLGVRYTREDYHSALQKTGLSVEYVGMTQDEIAGLNRSKKLKIKDYEWTFSGYQVKRFELTQVEATAFINEFLPAFNWVGRSQVALLENGDAAGSFKIYFDKVGEELIPDVVDLIPDPIAMLLPNQFNLYVEGTPFTIINNEIDMPDQLESLKVGPVSLRPILGDTDSSIREMVMGYVERIYKQIPQLQIDSLRINSRGNFEFSGRLPTQVTIWKR